MSNPFIQLETIVACCGRRVRIDSIASPIRGFAGDVCHGRRRTPRSILFADLNPRCSGRSILQPHQTCSWIFVEHGEAFLAVRPVIGEYAEGWTISLDDASPGLTSDIINDAYEWSPDHRTISLKDKHAGMIFEASRRTHHATLEAFVDEVLDNPLVLEKTVVPGFHVLRYPGAATRPGKSSSTEPTARFHRRGSAGRLRAKAGLRQPVSDSGIQQRAGGDSQRRSEAVVGFQRVNEQRKEFYDERGSCANGFRCE